MPAIDLRSRNQRRFEKKVAGGDPENMAPPVRMPPAQRRLWWENREKRAHEKKITTRAIQHVLNKVPARDRKRWAKAGYPGLNPPDFPKFRVWFEREVFMRYTANEIARVCHEVNRILQAAFGDPISPGYDDAAEEVKVAGKRGVYFHEQNPEATPEDSHNAWMDNKLAEGWTWGPIKDEVLKTHPSLKPYGELTVDQRMKDHIFRTIVNTMLSRPALDVVPLESRVLAEKPSPAAGWGESKVPGTAPQTQGSPSNPGPEGVNPNSGFVAMQAEMKDGANTMKDCVVTHTDAPYVTAGYSKDQAEFGIDQVTEVLAGQHVQNDDVMVPNTNFTKVEVFRPDPAGFEPGEDHIGPGAPSNSAASGD